MSRNDYEMVPTTSLAGAEYNPNTMTADAFAALLDEVREQGRLLKPIVVRDRNGERVRARPPSFRRMPSA
jgi:hypothetical protein